MTKTLLLLRLTWPWIIPPCALAAVLAYSIGVQNLKHQWPKLPTREHIEKPQNEPPPPNTVDLSQYSAIWQTPLFSDDRQPARSTQDEVDTSTVPQMDNFKLTGVVITSGMHVAMFQSSDNQGGAFHESETLPNGWTLVRVEDRKVILRYGSVEQTLELLTPKLPITLP